MAKKFNFKRILSLVMAFTMATSLLPMGALAATNSTSTTDTSSRISKTAEWNTVGDVADVSLSVPGNVEAQGSDIVFVIDKSSCGQYATNELLGMFQELAAAQAQSGTDIKVGVVQFNYTDHLDIPLTKLTSENASTLLDALQTYSGGTNMESGLLVAQEMLAADTAVPAENKYVILISDGLTWVYDDENGNPCTILWKNSAGVASAGTTGYSETRPGTYLDIPTGYTWDQYWTQVKTWVEEDGNKFDYTMVDYNSDEWKEKLTTEEAKTVALTSEEGQDHAVNMDRAMYDSWKAYSALQSAGYNCYVNYVSSDPAKFANSNGYHFMNMLAGDQKAVDFESIQDDIIYAVSSGSYVEDYMGYNFDFLVDGDITLTVGGVEYTTTKLETAKEGYDASYTFTAPDVVDPTFWLDYVKGNGKDTEKFVWTFGEALSAFYPAKLDYQVKLVEKKSDPAESTYKVDTNIKATLNPKASNSEEFGEPEEFPVPELNVPKYKVSYEYTGTVPQDAPKLDKNNAYKAAYYFADDSVTVADKPSLDGYTFSGWDSSDLENGKMPAKNVVITGSWEAIAPPTPVDPVDPEQKIPVNKTADGLDANDQTNVTLSVPGDSEDLSSDIVFIIGHGPSSNYGYILEMIHKMLVSTDGTPTKIKVGMVGFANTTEDETVLPLTEMKDTVPDNAVADYRNLSEAEIAELLAANPNLAEDMEFVIARALERAAKVYDGVNLESSLITARDMLAADTSVPAERKHMIVISTGLAYWFDNDDGKGSFIVRNNSGGKPQHGDNTRWLEHRHPGTSTATYGYKIPSAYIQDAETYTEAWNDYWADICTWIENDQDKYVYSVRDTYAAFVSRLKSRIITDADDLALVQKDESSKYQLLPYVANGNPKTNTTAQHALAYERGQYEALMVYRQMETPIGKTVTTLLKDENGNFKTLPGMGFNCYAIANGKGSNPGEEDQWMESDQIGYNFMHMMGGENTVNYRDRDTSFFDSIENKILYSCSVGSTVEDFIGYDAAKGNFEFVQDASTMTLTKGDVKYTAAQITAKEGATSSFAFTAEGASEPTFWLDYYYGDGKTTEKFIWTFGEDVSLAAPVSLTYKLQLTEKATAAGDYEVETNESATLYPKDSNGKGGEPQLFPVPNVEYTVVTETPVVNQHTVTVKYVDESGKEIATTYVSAPADEGTPYDVTSKDKIAINGYTYKETTGDPLTGTLNSDKVIIVTYTKNSNGGGNGGGGGGGVVDIPLAPIPEAFTADHYAYIIGYPKDYETGERTKDQTRMPVMPQGNITRAEVATIFFRLLDDQVRELNMVSENDFSDVNKGQWFNNAISTMASMGIVNGYPDGTFRPNGKITRAEFAAIAARFNASASTDGDYFTDIAGHWGEDEIYKATNSGWIKGYEDNTFKPNQLITRAEAMTLVNRVLHRLPETTDDLHDKMLKWVDNMDTSKWYYLAVQEATNSHDYTRDPSNIDYETWTEMREARDWSELEY